MDASKIKTLIIVVLAAFMALYLGIAAATAHIAALAWIGGGLFLSICLLLGKNVWILIPATLSLQGRISFLPGTPAPWHLMTLAALGFFLLRLAVRRKHFNLKWTWMETTIVLVGLTILQALMRNPTGVSLFGGETAGGKPYFLFAVAFVAYFLIATAGADFKTWRWAVILYITFGILDGLLKAAASLFPPLAAVILPIYSNVGFNEAMGTSGDIDLSQGRVVGLGQIGSMLGLIACTMWRPIAALDITKPWRGLTAGIAVISTLLSGFRGSTGALFVRFVVGSAIRRKPIDIAVICFIGLLAIAVLAVSGYANKLPFGIQRAVSFLPIELDHRARDQAESSSNERFEMWELALTSDRYISNKLLGDGFSLSRIEMQALVDAAMGATNYTSKMTWTESAMEMGNYHGFHVETIRFTGVVGLVAATFALFAFSSTAWRCIKAYRGSPQWGFVLFVCMPFLIHPYWYWLVFGSYKADFPGLIALAGMVKLLQVIWHQETTNTQLEPYSKSHLD